PLGRRRGPGAFDTAGDRVHALAAFEAAGPAEPEILDRAALRLGPDELRIARAMRLAEGVAAGDECHGLLVVHRHAREGLADVAARGRSEERRVGKECRSRW